MGSPFLYGSIYTKTPRLIPARRSCAHPSDWGRGPAAVPGACWLCLSQLHFPLLSFGLRAYRSFSLLGLCWRELGSVHLHLSPRPWERSCVPVCDRSVGDGHINVKRPETFSSPCWFFFCSICLPVYFTEYLIPTLNVLSSPFSSLKSLQNQWIASRDTNKCPPTFFMCGACFFLCCFFFFN